MTCFTGISVLISSCFIHWNVSMEGGGDSEKSGYYVTPRVYFAFDNVPNLI